MEIVKVLAGNRQIENDEKGQMITLFSHFEKLMITFRNLPWKRRFRVQRLQEEVNGEQANISCQFE
jgi:hypothetical protein